jgi:hypothetical protein
MTRTGKASVTMANERPKILRERDRAELLDELARVDRDMTTSRDRLTTEIPDRTKLMAALRAKAAADPEVYSAEDLAGIDEVIALQTKRIAEGIAAIAPPALLASILTAKGYTVTPPQG